jgi:hypothetical protein
MTGSLIAGKQAGTRRSRYEPTVSLQTSQLDDQSYNNTTVALGVLTSRSALRESTTIRAQSAMCGLLAYVARA